MSASVIGKKLQVPFTIIAILLMVTPFVIEVSNQWLFIGGGGLLMLMVIGIEGILGMVDKLRWPFLILAILAMMAAFAIEGSSGPGVAIFTLTLVDTFLWYITCLFGVGAVTPLIPKIIRKIRPNSKIDLGRIQWFLATAQGIVTFLIALCIILFAMVFIFIVIAMIFIMIALLFAIPFGTIVYFIKFADFDRGGAQDVLNIVIGLKITYAICLVLAQQRFLLNKGLVLLFFTSYICHIIINFLHGFVPGFLVSITDCVAAIVIAIIAILWGIFYLVGAIIAIIKALGGIVGIILIILAFSLIASLAAMLGIDSDMVLDLLSPIVEYFAPDMPI